MYKFTLQTFGTYQAQAYHSGFERTFGLLADFPQIGTDVNHIKHNHRRFRFQSHYVYYTEESYGVFIRAIIHAGQDIRPALFE
ncbi:MAG: type II toxin-antitoxin system RelE/ParE family toxin [Alphaproteobacteria bacterium]|nr:type II toxin-antitoxin system RelE/ParE family toxin [Alphaproteobacteria bacterium]